MAVNDRPVATDEDRLADAELLNAGANTRNLRGVRPAHATRRSAQLVGRHIGHRQLRQQVVAPFRGVIGDLGERALPLPASVRCRSRRARDFAFSLGVRPSDTAMTALGAYLSVDIGGFLFSFSEHAVRKGRGGHPTEARNLGLEAVNPTLWAAISHLRAPGHPSLLLWQCRLA